MNLWNRDTEINFFREALKSFASPEKVFYSLNSGHYAYVPKRVDTEQQTLQSRNSLIGGFTERWVKDLFEPLAEKLGYYAVNGVVCPDISLSNKSDGDLAFCSTPDKNQEPQNIKLIFEVKMSIVNNYKFKGDNRIEYIGDYNSHKGNPSLLRSDSMLKAIGKSINIRVSGNASAGIPIVILGNSPINESYVEKVDFLKKAGVIQGFWSLFPEPTDGNDYIKATPEKGFQTIEKPYDLEERLENLLAEEMHFFSSMVPKKQLGSIIYEAAKEQNDIKRAEKFLELLKQ